MSGTVSGALEGPSIDNDAALASALTRFPYEVVENIAHLTTDSATLATWMRVSRRMYNVAAPLLYQEGVVTRNASLYVGCEEVIDEPIEAVAGLFETAEDIENQGRPIPPLYSKNQLLPMIRHLYVHDLPSTDVYVEHIRLLQRMRSAGKSVSITVSIRPRAVGSLIKSAVDRSLPGYSGHPPGSHDFIRYLSLFDIDYLCVQLPVMDQHFEDLLVPNRKMPVEFSQIEYIRQSLHRLLVSNAHYESHDFFGLFIVPCQTLTIHNIALGICDRIIDFVHFGRTPTIRAFFRPCTDADEALVDKVSDRYCYNHCNTGTPNMNDNADLDLGPKIINSKRHFEFIDIDWVRGKYNPTRSGDPVASMNRQVELQIKEATLTLNWPLPPKDVKMSREVEACTCCGRHQLSAVELDQLQSAEVKGWARFKARKVTK